MGRGVRRTKDLNFVFKDGNSPFLNEVGALCILFDDLKTERVAFLAAHGEPDHGRQQQRQFYYVRRSLITLYEFRERLESICSRLEFREAQDRIPEMHRTSILKARRFLSRKNVLRDFRNDLGAHVNPDLVGAAIKYTGDGAVSSVGWEYSESEGFTLDVPFANDIFRGAFASKLPGGVAHLEDAMKDFFNLLLEGLQHAQEATFALVSTFLWERFGGKS